MISSDTENSCAAEYLFGSHDISFSGLFTVSFDHCNA